MLQFLWLTRLRDRWLGEGEGQSRKRRRPRRLHLEVLEDRLVMSGGPPTPPVDPGAPPPVSGTWTKVTSPPTGIGTMFLLPNGDVMAQEGSTTNTWYELQPNSSGSYANGTWTKLASMSTQRLYFGSAVLPDDKVFVGGGEYSGPSGAQNLTNTGEIYDIATNSWKSTPDFP